MTQLRQVVVFYLDSHKLMVPLTSVKKVLLAAEITPVPNAPAYLLGILSIAGETVPVLNLRKLLKLPEKPVSHDNHFLLIQTPSRKIILVADRVEGYFDLEDKAEVISQTALPGLDKIKQIYQTSENFLMLADIDALLHQSEEDELDTLLGQSQPEVETKREINE